MKQVKGYRFLQKLVLMQSHVRVPMPRAMPGFSLLELLVAIAVASVLLSIAVPSFTNIMTSNRLSSTANELIGAISLARIQAIKRNTPTQFCSNDSFYNGADALGLACNTSAGAVITLNPDGTTTTIAGAPDVASTVTIRTSSDMTALRFRGNGLATTPTGTVPFTGLIADVYSDRITENNHRCIYLITGSTVVSCRRTASTGGCPVNEPNNCQR